MDVGTLQLLWIYAQQQDENNARLTNMGNKVWLVKAQRKGKNGIVFPRKERCCLAKYLPV